MLQSQCTQSSAVASYYLLANTKSENLQPLREKKYLDIAL